MMPAERKAYMKRYTYPAIITPEAEGGYSVLFPDLEGCYTCGDDLGEALYMAEDVLAYTLYDYEKEKREIPAPTPVDALQLGNGEFVNYVTCDTLEYQRMNNNKSVKKTLSVPEWLNQAAIDAGVNFSQVLQDALKAKLGLL